MQVEDSQHTEEHEQGDGVEERATEHFAGEGIHPSDCHNRWIEYQINLLNQCHQWQGFGFSDHAR